MEGIQKDVLIQLALKLSLNDLNSLCRSSVKFSKICNDKNFWYRKLKQDFDIPSLQTKDPKRVYKEIIENRRYCNEHNLTSHPNGSPILHLTNPENFTNQNDGYVFRFLINKIFEKLSPSNEFSAGVLWIYNKYISEINHLYGNILTLKSPSEAEFNLFDKLLKKIADDPQIDTFSRSLALAFYEKIFPVDIIWEELCQYKLYIP